MKTGLEAALLAPRVIRFYVTEAEYDLTTGIWSCYCDAKPLDKTNFNPVQFISICYEAQEVFYENYQPLQLFSPTIGTLWDPESYRVHCDLGAPTKYFVDKE